MCKRVKAVVQKAKAHPVLIRRHVLVAKILRRPSGVSAAGLKLIKDFEGFEPVPKDDPVGVPTVGYGTTTADVRPLPKHLTEPQASRLLLERLNHKYLPPVLALKPGLNQHQLDATVSFVYNLGVGMLQGSHDFGRHLRAKQWRQAADSMLEYDMAGGKVLEGLKRRRAAERALFLGKP